MCLCLLCECVCMCEWRLYTIRIHFFVVNGHMLSLWERHIIITILINLRSKLSNFSRRLVAHRCVCVCVYVFLCEVELELAKYTFYFHTLFMSRIYASKLMAHCSCELIIFTLGFSFIRILSLTPFIVPVSFLTLASPNITSFVSIKMPVARNYIDFYDLFPDGDTINAHRWYPNTITKNQSA